MKKIYFEPETEVTEMFLNKVVLETSPTGERSDDEKEELSKEEDFGTNQRNAGREATWGNLW